MGKGKTPISKGGQKRVGKKIAHLMDEGKPQKVAVATALNMEREHRLGAKGGYKPVKKKARR